jgi:hypothetical protein
VEFGLRTEPMAMPATEPVTRTREGSSLVALAWRSGANLSFVSFHPIFERTTYLWMV